MASLDGLHPTVRKATEELIKLCKAEGIEITIAQGYRSTETQNGLYAQGRTKPGKIVTNAKGGSSYHNYGLAIDYCIIKNGKAVWEVNDKWKRVAAIGKKLGFKWGGDWTSFKDYPHLEMTFGLSIADLKAGKRPAGSAKATTAATPAKSTPAKQATASKDKYPLPEGTLYEGAHNKEATTKNKQLQTALNAAGYSCGTADGKFGPKTTAALKKFQKAAGLTADGKYGPKTKAALDKKVN